jgi:hypothetical protein
MAEIEVGRVGTPSSPLPPDVGTVVALPNV